MAKANAITPLDPDPQTDYLGQHILDLLRLIRNEGRTGQYTIEINAHQGDLAKSRILRPADYINMPAEIRGPKTS